jgi:Tlde1 domain
LTLGVRRSFGICRFDTLTVRQSVCGASALVATASLFLCAIFAQTHNDLHQALPTPLPTRSTPYFSFLDSRFDLYFLHETFSQSLTHPPDYQQTTAALFPLTASSELIETVKSDGSNAADASLKNPPPLRRPTFAPRPSQENIPQSSSPVANTPSNDGVQNPSDRSANAFKRFFAKLFGRPLPSSVSFASATADDSQLGPSSITSRYDPWTAVYDISAHTVYMPDGTKLEAHSGFGPSLDDPTQVDERDLGPTPPDVYNLALREQSFHGVQALRLIPVDEQKTLGRTGLLAHSFMLGSNGQSNGCVSFKDYDAFLRAYMKHQIKRLVVVARLD